MEQKNTIKATEGKMLFEQIHSVIIDKKLFLNPQFSRNEYIALGAANRNKAAQLLREFAGTNLYGYINDMRLEYARELMHERPDAPVKAISACRNTGQHPQITEKADDTVHRRPINGDTRHRDRRATAQPRTLCY